MSALQAKFDTCQAAMAVWEATASDGNLDTDGPEFESLEAAELAFIGHQCTSPEEGMEKLRLTTSCSDLMDTIRDGRSADGSRYFWVFMQSLITAPDLTPTVPIDESGQSCGFGIAPVDNSGDIGDNL